MKIIIEGSVKEINGLLESLSKKGNFKSESAEPMIDLSKLSEFAKDKLANSSCVPKEKVRHGKVTNMGLKIGKKFYTFGNEYDMWKFLGETITVIDENAFDVFGNNLGKIISV